WIVDDVLPGADRHLLWEIGLGLVAVTVGYAIGEISRGLLRVRFETWADHILQAALWDRILRVKVPFFRTENSGTILFRALTIRGIRRALSSHAARTFLASLFGLTQLALLFVYSWSLALLAAALGLVVALVTMVACVFISRLTSRLVDKNARLLGLTI